MTDNARYDRTSKGSRRRNLDEIRALLGDKLFAEFIIDQLAENGSAAPIDTLPALVDVWMSRRLARLARAEAPG